MASGRSVEANEAPRRAGQVRDRVEAPPVIGASQRMCKVARRSRVQLEIEVGPSVRGRELGKEPDPGKEREWPRRSRWRFKSGRRLHFPSGIRVIGWMPTSVSDSLLLRRAPILLPGPKTDLCKRLLRAELSAPSS